jgi:O-acetyl-ADP-ribose deacetylase (regulator of RNase III)
MQSSWNLGLEGRRGSRPKSARLAEQACAPAHEIPFWPNQRDLRTARRRKQDEADPVSIEHVEGDLLDQAVEALVNPWNRNVIPWWLLLPQGVSGALKRRAGVQPFREVARHGAMPLGSAVVTGAGRLPQRAIIHVAGINLLWTASERSIRSSAHNALLRAQEHGFTSLAFPAIGAGSGRFDQDQALALIQDEVERHPFDGRIVLVRYRPPRSGAR